MSSQKVRDLLEMYERVTRFKGHMYFVRKTRWIYSEEGWAFTDSRRRCFSEFSMSNFSGVVISRVSSLSCMTTTNDTHRYVPNVLIDKRGHATYKDAILEYLDAHDSTTTTRQISQYVNRYRCACTLAEASDCLNDYFSGDRSACRFQELTAEEALHLMTAHFCIPKNTRCLNCSKLFEFVELAITEVYNGP